MAVILQRLENITGIPTDQLAFFVSQVLSIIFGFLLRAWLPPRKDNAFRRHLSEIVLGFVVMYICYGGNMYHLAMQAIPAYLMMVFLPANIAQYGVLIFAMFYLSVAHIQRLYSFELRNKTVDITAPLMIQTQKLSSLAFNLYDGDVLKHGGEPSRDVHKQHAIKGRPRLVQLMSYLLCYQNSMVGPFVFFSDYMCFIEGREEDQITDETEREFVIKHKKEIRSAKSPLKRQLLACAFHVVLVIYATNRFKPEFLISDDFQRLGLVRKYFWLTLSCFYFRQKFYFAWAISGASMMAAGFGFSGLKKDGSLEPEYKNAINIHFFGIELGTNTKVMLDAWNTGTTRWLRECVYDRVPKRFSVVAVFFVSAFWHGFYAVYYLCFLSAALITMTGRLCRNHVRPYFIGNYWNHRLYDIMTHLSAMFCFNYLGTAFLLLDCHKALQLWGNFYFLGQLGPLIIFFLLPYALPKAIPEMVKKDDVVDFSYELNLAPGTLNASSSSSLGSKSLMDLTNQKKKYEENSS